MKRYTAALLFFCSFQALAVDTPVPISTLPSVTMPLAGTEVLPIVQTNTKKVTVTNLLSTTQPLDASLTAYAALVSAASKGFYFTGADVPALFDLSAFGMSQIDDADAAAGRATLGATTAGSGFFTLANPGAITFPKIDASNVVTAESASTYRTSLGVGTADSPTFAGTKVTGQSLIGGTTAITVNATSSHGLQLMGAGVAGSVAAVRYGAATTALTWALGKSRSATAGSFSPLVDGDGNFIFAFVGDDGSTLNTVGARYEIEVQGTVSTGVVPMRHRWRTMNAAGTAAYRMNLEARGALLLGTSTDDAVSLLQVAGLTTTTTLKVATSVVDGGGLKHKRVTTGSIATGTTALVTITWDTAFSSTSYTVTCGVLDATTSSLSLSVVHIETQTTSAVAVRVLNNSLGSLTGTLGCIAMHD